MSFVFLTFSVLIESWWKRWKKEVKRERRDECSYCLGSVCTYVCAPHEGGVFRCHQTNCEPSVSCDRLMLHQELALLVNKELMLNGCVTQ